MKHPNVSRAPHERVSSTLPKLTTVRRRLTSRLQPLHGGMGFGAGEIKERAMVVARQASQRGHHGALNSRMGKPGLGATGEGLQFTEEKTVIREPEQIPFLLDEQHTDTNQKLNELSNGVRRAVTLSEIQPEASRRPIASGSTIPSIKSFIASQRRDSIPSALQGFTAWFFDTLVLLACVLLSFTLSASVPFITLLAQKFPTAERFASFDSSGAVGWLIIGAQTLTLAALLLFAVQALSGFFLAATVGRAIADVRLVRSRSAMGRAFKIALGEVLQVPLGFGLLNLIVSREHNFLIRSLRWCRGSSSL